MANDDEKPSFGMPAFIRSMLDPYRVVDGTGSPVSPTPQHESTYLIPIFRPGDEAVLAIGRVTVAWSIMEKMIGMLVARLSLAPDFTAMAITRELAPHNQINVLRMLLPLHLERYANRIASPEQTAEIDAIIRQVGELRKARNAICHTVWVKDTASDGIRALPDRPMTASKTTANPGVSKTVSEINQIAAEIQALADRAFVVAQSLPGTDEALHIQSLAP